ncbi:hypothetical protein GAB14E_0851 [Colwellia psychrerythraea]|uniref:Uncharacterized protein n=1 Tax=Colwellia psychrerythraea TaxID=28229 RepID=A0A099L4L9_COLPS|nr:hypothetical protein GAB14E_0851 [Colwellia psychrerythraea]
MIKGKALIKDNGYPLSKSITRHLSLLNLPFGSALITLVQLLEY